MTQERKKIIFSHHYPKLHGQTSGKLIGIEYINADESDEFKELLDYDTVYYEKDGTEGRYPIEYHTNYMQLVFVGNKHIPFCTLRLMKNEDRVKYYHNAIGHMFDFEFLDDYPSILTKEQMQVCITTNPPTYEMQDVS